MKMREKIIFEIPIYAMSEKEFNRRWQKEKEKLYEQFILGGHSDKTKIESLIKDIFFPRDVWKFNQIIGYIRLSVTRQDVLFEIYLARAKRYHANSRVKKFITYYPAHKTHFYAMYKSDEEIKKGISDYLKHIEKFHIKKRFYIDYSVFNNIIDHIKIKEIMASI